MCDELTHRSLEDGGQDQLAAGIAATSAGTPERAKAVQNANTDWSGNPGAIEGLVNNKNGKNYLEGIISKTDFNKDPCTSGR